MYNIMPLDSRLCAKRGLVSVKEQVKKIEYFPNFTQSNVTASATFPTVFVALYSHAKANV